MSGRVRDPRRKGSWSGGPAAPSAGHPQPLTLVHLACQSVRCTLAHYILSPYRRRTLELATLGLVFSPAAAAFANDTELGRRLGQQALAAGQAGGESVLAAAAPTSASEASPVEPSPDAAGGMKGGRSTGGEELPAGMDTADAEADSGSDSDSGGWAWWVGAQACCFCMCGGCMRREKGLLRCRAVPFPLLAGLLPAPPPPGPCPALQLPVQLFTAWPPPAHHCNRPAGSESDSSSSSSDEEMQGGERRPAERRVRQEQPMPGTGATEQQRDEGKTPRKQLKEQMRDDERAATAQRKQLKEQQKEEKRRVKELKGEEEKAAKALHKEEKRRRKEAERASKAGAELAPGQHSPSSEGAPIPAAAALEGDEVAPGGQKQLSWLMGQLLQ